MKIELSACALQTRFEHHDTFKNQLLHAIDNETDVRTDNCTETQAKLISRLDWHNCDDFSNRAWVRIILDKLLQHFNQVLPNIGYTQTDITQLWFQQYNENDTHRWHVHGDNYTGVYYLEFPPGSPTTQIIDHNNTTTNVDAHEGDIIVFPSFFVHRSPPVVSKLRKTIISFNLLFKSISQDHT